MMKKIKLLIKKILRFFGRYLLLIYVHINPCRYGLNKKNRKRKIIVSLTSYPQRFDSIGLTLKSLLLQSIKPDKIIVWLGNDTPENGITNSMNEFIKYGVEYRYDRNENIKPHKKYFYALQEFHDDLVITVDDDIIYPPTLISSLIRTHQKFPLAICSRRVHRVKIDKNGQIDKYKHWEWEYDEGFEPSFLNFGTNGAGTLFPPNALVSEAFDLDKIKEYCLNADDVWIWFMSIRSGMKIVWAPCLLIHPPVVKETRKLDSLAKMNVENSGNDYFINKMNVIYPIQSIINCELHSSIN